MTNQSEKPKALDKKREKIVYVSPDESELLDSATRDAHFPTFTSWAKSVLISQAKNQLGLYDICDYDDNLRKVGIATREQFDSHQKEIKSKNRGWSYLNGKRVVIQ